MVSMKVITLFVLSDTLSHNRILLQPHQQTTSQSQRSISQFLRKCPLIFFRFLRVSWEVILPPAVSLSLILAELDFLSSILPILLMSNKLLIVSWWSWWESHPCLKSYWTTSLPLLTEGIDSVIFRILWIPMKRRTMWEPLYFDFQSLESANFSRIVITSLEIHSNVFNSELLERNPHISTSYLRVTLGGVTLAEQSTNWYYLWTKSPPPTQIWLASHLKLIMRKT